MLSVSVRRSDGSRLVSFGAFIVLCILTLFAAGCGGGDDDDPVITSYSIHYTKLYERVLLFHDNAARFYRL